ncbi:scavenger receptor class F member 1-like [Haliotis rubra]|uniref:scavenger receptor class F member 1-like n=1 Tax=Haliotis rubra TaxID=36100 RepID=UPI001EE51F42|nr:scavenger receptor class F member 1-like [Haliotis rubra]
MSTQADKCTEDQHCSNCSSTTQYCSTDCFSGYFGLKCKSRCSKQCINSKCSQTLRGTYSCSDGCVPGFYGTRCNIPCTLPTKRCTKCPQGCDGTFCYLTTSCVSGCHDQYYGFNCKNCSPRCRQCNRITGRCDVCHNPYHGLDCEYSCEHCSTTDCVQTCAPGFYGRTCSLRCHKYCLSYPSTITNDSLTSNSSTSCISECQRYSGDCINGCADDWSGPYCSSPIKCNPNCLGCNETGACVEGCMSGYYGDDCKPCPGTCFNYTCYRNNGSCDNGCIQGQYGQSCQLPCINCPGGVCHPSTGICIQGSTVHVVGLGLSTGCVILIVCTVCIFVFHLRRRRQTTERNHQRNESIHTERSGQLETGEYYPVHRYWDIDDYDEVSQQQGQQQVPVKEEDYDVESQRQGQLQVPVKEEDYDEVSQRQGQQQVPVKEEDYNEVSQRQGQQQVPAEEEDYDEGSQQLRQHQGQAEEEYNSDPALPALADCFPGPHGSEDDDSNPVLPVLADYFPGAQGTEDNNDGDTSHSSASGSQSYTPLMWDVFVDDP